MRTNRSPWLTPSDGFSFARKRLRGVTVARKSSDRQKQGATDYSAVLACSVEQKAAEQHYYWP